MRQKMQYMQGYMTVFLTLTLTVVISLCLTLVEGVRRNTMILEIECVTDTAMNSILAEYHRELLNQYGLFFIDTSYGTAVPSYEKTGEHLMGYLDRNLGQDETLLSAISGDFLGLHAESVEMKGVSGVADGEGIVLRRQIASYMEEQVGLAYVKKIQEWMGTIEKYELDGNKFHDRKEQAKQELQTWNQELQGWEDQDLAWDKLPQGWGQEIQIWKTLQAGILNLVTDVSELSDEMVHLGNCLSHRSVRQGTGMNPDITYTDGDLEQILMHEYVLKKTGRYGEPKEGAVLQYQTEYILAGQACDVDNLRMVTEALMLLRETANALHIIGDQEKMTWVTETSELVASALTLPEASPVIQVLLIAAWSGIESLRDVKLLLAGEQIPLIKGESQWYFGLHGMGTGGNAIEENDGTVNGEGLCYADYLRIFLLLQDKEVTTYRLLDIMEMDIRKTEGNGSFQIDGCIDSVEAEIFITGGDNYEFYITRRYGY